MRRRLGMLSILCLIGLTTWGCGPPQFTPMLPPGVTLQRVSSDQMEALGEVQSRGTLQPSNVAPGKSDSGAPTGAQAPAAGSTSANKY